jgi:transglutaminase-like putative cysteine protease
MPAHAGGVKDLTYAGVPVDFATWAPESATFNYGDVDLGAERRRELERQEFPSIERLHRLHLDQLADGTIEETVTMVRFYLTQSGIADEGNLRFWVDASSETATIVQAYALFPDGRHIEVEPDTIQLVADSTDDIFTDSFEVSVPYAGLTPGAAAVLVVKKRQEYGARQVPWSRIYYPQWFTPLDEFDLHLTWQDPLRQPLWKKDYEDLKCLPQGDHAIRCRAFDLPPYPEDQNVSYSDTLPSLVVAERTTWSDLARHTRALIESAISNEHSGPQQVLDELIDGDMNRLEGLRRIHEFVSQKIRYVGLEQGIGDVVPRPSALTLARRFGDCKDKTTLFIDLARRAGFDAYPVLTSTSRSRPEKLLIPAANFFDHMVACVKLYGKKEYCVDLTDPYSPYDTISGPIQGAIRLDLTEASTSPDTFPTAPYAHRLSVTTVNKLEKNGAIEESQTRNYFGRHAAALRAKLQPMNKSNRQQYLLDWYHESVADGVTPSFEVDRLGDVRKPVVIRSNVYFRSRDPQADSISYWEAEPTLRTTLPRIKSENTAHPYRFKGMKYDGESIYHLPKGKKVLYTGPTINLESSYGGLRRHYEVSGSVVRVFTELSLKRADISLDEISRFNKFVDFLAESAPIWFEMGPG